MPPTFEDSFSPVYNGPTFINSKGHHAATFYEFPIKNELPAPDILNGIIDEVKSSITFTLQPLVDGCNTCNLTILQRDTSNNTVLQSKPFKLSINTSYVFSVSRLPNTDQLYFDLYYESDDNESEVVSIAVKTCPIIWTFKSVNMANNSHFKVEESSILFQNGFTAEVGEDFNVELQNCPN